MADIPRLDGEDEYTYNSRKLIVSILDDVVSKLEDVYTADTKEAKLILSSHSGEEICRFTHRYRAKLKVGKTTVRLWAHESKETSLKRCVEQILRSSAYKMHLAIANERNKYRGILAMIAKNRKLDVDPDVMLFQLLQESAQ